MTSLMIELDCHLVPGVHLDPVDRRIDPPNIRVAYDHQAAGANIWTAVFQVPMWHWKLAKIDGVTDIRIFEEVYVVDLHRLPNSRPSRSAIHALSASNGLSVGSIPSAKAARCTLYVALVKIRNPVGYPFIWSNYKAGQSGSAAATSVMPPYLEIRICTHNATQRFQTIYLLYKASQIDIAHTRHPDHLVPVNGPKQPRGERWYFKISRSNFRLGLD